MTGHQGKTLSSEVLTDVAGEIQSGERYPIYKQEEFNTVSCISSYLQNSAQRVLHKYAAQEGNKIHSTFPVDISKSVFCVLNKESLT